MDIKSLIFLKRRELYKRGEFSIIDDDTLAKAYVIKDMLEGFFDDDEAELYANASEADAVIFTARGHPFLAKEIYTALGEKQKMGDELKRILDILGVERE